MPRRPLAPDDAATVARLRCHDIRARETTRAARAAGEQARRQDAHTQARREAALADASTAALFARWARDTDPRDARVRRHFMSEAERCRRAAQAGGRGEGV